MHSGHKYIWVRPFGRFDRFQLSVLVELSVRKKQKCTHMDCMHACALSFFDPGTAMFAGLPAQLYLICGCEVVMSVMVIDYSTAAVNTIC